MHTISAGEFKAKCLKLMDVVFKTHEEYLITKRGKPIAKIVPVESIEDPFGFLNGTVTVKGDIDSYSLEEEWEADK